MVTIIDATNKSLGRLASEVARLLMGKDKPHFDPSKEMAEVVVVNNLSKIKIDKRKFERKYYFKFGRKLGSLKRYSFKEIFEKDPKRIFLKAVSGMLPKNKLREKRLKKLKLNL